MANWVSSWGQAPTAINVISPDYKNRTMRLTIANNIKGDKIRIRLSNRDGKKTMHIVEAAVQVTGKEQKQIFFDGKQEIYVQPQGEQYSDAVEMKVASGDYITISMAFEGPVTCGNGIVESVHCSTNGNFVKAEQFVTVHRSKNACYHDMIQAIPALSSVEVLCTEEDAGAIVCFGDSITQQSNWTKPLASKLAELCPDRVSVINKGIGGNRLLRDPMIGFLNMYGQAGIKRFDRDVLDETGVKAVIFAIGTNDFGMARNPEKPDWVTAQNLIDTYIDLIKKAKAKGLKVYGTTILPREGTTGYLKEQEIERLKFNDWMRTTDVFDKVFDFDQIIRNPNAPAQMRMEYDSGDHLHPGPIGGLKMAEAIWKEV